MSNCFVSGNCGQRKEQMPRGWMEPNVQCPGCRRISCILSVNTGELSYFCFGNGIFLRQNYDKRGSVQNLI